MSDEPKGLYSKYNVTKADGTPIEDNDIFVLRPGKDFAAVAAMRAYALAVATTNPKLSQEINDWMTSLQWEGDKEPGQVLFEATPPTIKISYTVTWDMLTPESKDHWREKAVAMANSASHLWDVKSFVQYDEPMTNLVHIILVGGLVVWFSYNKLVAFKVHDKRYVMENHGNPQMGRHLNYIDGGDRRSRVPQSMFENLLKAYKVDLNLSVDAFALSPTFDDFHSLQAALYWPSEWKAARDTDDRMTLKTLRSRGKARTFQILPQVFPE